MCTLPAFKHTNLTLNAHSYKFQIQFEIFKPKTKPCKNQRHINNNKIVPSSNCDIIQFLLFNFPAFGFGLHSIDISKKNIVYYTHPLYYIGYTSNSILTIKGSLTFY